MRGAIALPLAVFVIGNTLLRIYHKCSKASALLDAAMSIVAPVKFFLFDRKYKGLQNMRMTSSDLLKVKVIFISLSRL